MKGESLAGMRLKIFLAWPLILSVIVFAANMCVAAWNAACGLVMLPFSLIYFGISLWIFFYSRKNMFMELTGIAGKYARIQQKLVTDMRVPYALADENGRIFWYNTAFRTLSGKLKRPAANITQMFPDVTAEGLKELKDTWSFDITLAGGRYRVELQYVKDVGEINETEEGEASRQDRIYAVYLIDESEVAKCRKELHDEKFTAGLIYIDNFDEAMEAVDDVRRSMLAALVERRINKYIAAEGGVICRMEKDKYFFSVRQRSIYSFQEEQFSLLEEVKQVNIMGKSMTLSMSVGMGAETFAGNYEYARVAMDMALGRGGDQAVVKDGSQVRYYGGKSQQTEKTTRVKSRVKAQALKELMETKDRVLIMGHRLGDIDCLGAGIGIYRIATALGKKSNIVINELTTSVHPMLEKFRASQEYPDDFVISGTKALELVDSSAMLVVVDVNRPVITEAPELLRQIKTVVVLDHHRQSADVITGAVLSYIEPSASSACELVAEVMQYISEGIKIKPLEADAMYAGIVVDTNNFQNQTGVRTFEACAWLRRNGADVTRVRKLFRDSLADSKARAATISSAEIYKGSFAIAVCQSEGLQNATVVCAQAANELLAVREVRASIVVTAYHGTIYLSARSIDDINVQVMMEKLGGGGHRTVAGAQLSGVTAAEAVQRVKATIDQMQQKGEIE